jgi:hypothetical protein
MYIILYVTMRGLDGLKKGDQKICYDKKISKLH